MKRTLELYSTFNNVAFLGHANVIRMMAHLCKTIWNMSWVTNATAFLIRVLTLGQFGMVQCQAAPFDYFMC